MKLSYIESSTENSASEEMLHSREKGAFSRTRDRLIRAEFELARGFEKLNCGDSPTGEMPLVTD
jgi:hypothetical protein